MSTSASTFTAPAAASSSKKAFAPDISVKRIANAQEAIAGFLWATAIMENSGWAKLKTP